MKMVEALAAACSYAADAFPRSFEAEASALEMEKDDGWDDIGCADDFEIPASMSGLVTPARSGHETIH
jgi:hypothetical protein